MIYYNQAGSSIIYVGMFIHHSLNNYMRATMEQLLTSQGREGCMVFPNIIIVLKIKVN